MTALQCPLKDFKFLKSVLPMKLHHLQEIADHIASGNCSHPPTHLKDFIFDQDPVIGTTPLIIACQRGEFDSVTSLVETWGVDVRAPAKYYSNLSQYFPSVFKVDSVTPLFVAALYGYDKIVSYLLGKGANVSVKTSNKKDFSQWDGLTPLYGALSDRECNFGKPLPQEREDRSNIVRSLLKFGADPARGRPIWIEKMCGVDATTALINYGLDLNRRFLRTHETLVHHWASRPHDFTEEDSLVIVKLLVGKGADLLARDVEGFTPLLRAANCSNTKILDYLLERNEYDRTEKMVALELAGASILLDSRNASHFPKAFEYWRRAHHLRQMEVEVSGSSAQKILGRKIGNNVEWTTLAELDQLEQHPEDYRIQALLVELRILSGFLERGHYRLSLQYIRWLNNVEYEEKFNQIIDIRWGMFDVAIRCLGPLPIKIFVWVRQVEDANALVDALSILKENRPALLDFETLKTSLDLILLATDLSRITITNRDNETLNYYGDPFFKNLINLLEMFFNLPEILKEHETISLIQSLRLLGPYRLGNLLFPACKKLTNFKSLALVRVLLEAGADPNLDIDELNGNASLHVVAGMIDRKLGDAAGLLLVEYGARLRQVNEDGKTALDIWIQLNETEDKWNEEVGGLSARPEWCRPVPTLLRLAARVIRVHKIPYANAKTPTTLHSLIELRSKENY